MTARCRPALLLAAMLAVAGARGADPAQEVRDLIARVAASGCTFIRNGTAHDAAAAADHLQLKYRRGERYVDTAEQFIDRLASESSWTGRPYLIRCDGVTEPARDWLYRALEDQRAGR